VIELNINLDDAMRQGDRRIPLPTAAQVSRVAANAAKEELIAHFLLRDREGNAKGWPSSGLWSDIARRVVIENSGDVSRITIGDIRFWRKLLGGPPITPKRGKYLTIPANADAYKAGSPSEGNTPELKRMLAYNADVGHWMGALVAAVDYQRVLKSGKRKGQTVRAKRGEQAELGSGSVWYWLARETNPPADPGTMPRDYELETAISTAAGRFLSRFGEAA
jgi:hypothetical protein